MSEHQWSKDACGAYKTLVVEYYEGHEQAGDICNDPLDAIKSAMDSTLIIQVSKDK